MLPNLFVFFNLYLYFSQIWLDYNFLSLSRYNVWHKCGFYVKLKKTKRDLRKSTRSQCCEAILSSVLDVSIVNLVYFLDFYLRE